MNLINVTKSFVNNNKMSLLLATSLTGFVSTVVLAARATPLAYKHIEYDCAETVPQKIKSVWRDYLPAGIVGGITIASIVCSHRLHTKNALLLGSLYQSSQETLKRYRHHTIEAEGAEADKLRYRKSTDDHTTHATTILYGDVILCYDAHSGRQFQIEADSLRAIENKLNHLLIHEGTVLLNEYYHEVGLEPNKDGEMMGWNVDDGMIELYYDSSIDKKGRPQLMIDYDVKVVRNI